MTPAERAAYQRGMEAARSIMVAETVAIVDAHGLAVLSLAFRAVSEGIAKVAGVVPAGHRVDYLAMVQEGARQAAIQPGTNVGYSERITPIGTISCSTGLWEGRWTSVYRLNGQRVTVRQIIDLGLAQRPTSRERKKKNG